MADYYPLIARACIAQRCDAPLGVDLVECLMRSNDKQSLPVHLARGRYQPCVSSMQQADAALRYGLSGD